MGWFERGESLTGRKSHHRSVNTGQGLKESLHLVSIGAVLVGDQYGGHGHLSLDQGLGRDDPILGRA